MHASQAKALVPNRPAGAHKVSNCKQPLYLSRLLATPAASQLGLTGIASQLLETHQAQGVPISRQEHMGHSPCHFAAGASWGVCPECACMVWVS